MTNALFAFSADPVTHAHVDLIERASGLFPHLVVAVATSGHKVPFLPLEPRLTLIQESLFHLPNVDVVSFQGLTTDYLQRSGIRVLVRSLRDGIDAAYEHSLYWNWETQLPDEFGLEIVYLPPKRHFLHISSSAVREIFKNEGNILGHTSLLALDSLRRHAAEMVVIGIVGRAGAGKSTVRKQLIEGLGADRTVGFDLDVIGHQALDTLTPTLVAHFGPEILEDGRVSRPKLGDIVFHSSEKLSELEDLLRAPILLGFRRALLESRRRDGEKVRFVLIEGSRLIEEDWLFLCCNHVVHVVCEDPAVRYQRLRDRGYSAERIEVMDRRQLGEAEKKARIVSRIQETGVGRLWTVSGVDGTGVEAAAGDIGELLGKTAVAPTVQVAARVEDVMEVEDIVTRLVGPGHGAWVREMTERQNSPDRPYHNTAHVLTILQLIDAHAWLLGDPDALRLAAFLHDVVLLRDGDRSPEQQSADLVGGLEGCGRFDAARLARVEALILATAHTDSPELVAPADFTIGERGDRQLFHDMDLAVLATPPASYRRYATAIEHEYRHLHGISIDRYRIGRMDFLQKMLKRVPLYETPWFRRQYEIRARMNLRQEWQDLDHLLKGIAVQESRASGV